MPVAIRQETRSTGPDGTIDALVKLVPGEIIALHVALLQTPRLPGDANVHVGIVAVLAFLTAFVLWWSSRASDGSPRTPVPALQYVLRPAAFVLVALSTDHVLVTAIGDAQWIPAVFGILLAFFGALLLKGK